MNGCNWQLSVPPRRVLPSILKWRVSPAWPAWRRKAGDPQEKALKRAVADAADESANPELRADAVGLLGLGGFDNQAALFKRLVDPKEPEPVQAAAVRTLGQLKGEEIGTFLLAKWRT